MKELLVLTDVSQVNAALHRPDLASVQLVTANLAVAELLTQRGVAFLDEWDLLTGEEIQSHWQSAHDLAFRWWELLPGCAPALPLQLAQTELADLFAWCLHARCLYERLLHSQRVNAISGYFLPAVPVCRMAPHPVERAMASISHAVLRWCALQRRIPLRTLRLPQALSNACGALFSAASPPARLSPVPQLSPVHCVQLTPAGPLNWWGTRPKPEVAKSCRTVLGMEVLAPAENRVLESLFQQTPGWQFLQVRYPMQRASGGGPLSNHALLLSLCECQRRFHSCRASYSGPHPEIFANPFLRFQFDRIWAEMRAALQLGESFRLLLRTIQPALVLFGYDGFILERRFKQIARAEGVPTAALIHGGLNHSVGQRICVSDADTALLWGPKDAANMARYGLPAERVRLVGSLRYGERHQDGVRTSSEEKAQLQFAARQHLQIPSGKAVVVFLTATILPPVGPLASPARHRETWRHIRDLAARRQDLVFLIKPHPGWDQYEFYRVLCREGPANLRFLFETPLDPVLAAADAVVLVNYCTTAALEAMLWRLPVVFLDTALYPIEASRHSLSEGGVVVVGSVGALEHTLDRVICEGVQRQTAVQTANQILPALLGPANASVQVMQVCAEVALPAPADRPCQPPNAQVYQSLTETLAALATGASHQEFIAHWAKLVHLLAASPMDGEVVLQVCRSVSHEIGVVATSPEQLHHLIARCYRLARKPLSLRSRQLTQLVACAWLAGITRHVDNGNWSQAAALLQYAARKSPRTMSWLTRFPTVLERMGVALADAERHAADARLLARLRRSWAWKLGRLVARPAIRLVRLIRGKDRQSA